MFSCMATCSLRQAAIGGNVESTGIEGFGFGIEKEALRYVCCTDNYWVWLSITAQLSSVAVIRAKGKSGLEIWESDTWWDFRSGASQGTSQWESLFHVSNILGAFENFTSYDDHDSQISRGLCEWFDKGMPEFFACNRMYEPYCLI